MSSLTTKKAIAYTLKEVLLDKPLSKVTINDITKRCDINRQTFYYHFQDIYALVEWICVEDVNKALEEKRNYATWQEGFLSIFEAMKKDKAFIENVYHSVSHEMFTKNLYSLVFPIIYDVVKEKTIEIEMKEEDRVFITDFYKYSFVAIVLKWIEDGMVDDPNEIVNRVSSIVTGTIEHAIKTFNPINKNNQK